MKKFLLLIISAFLYLHPVFCQTLYTSTAINGLAFSPGQGISGTPKVVLDDVLIPSALVQGTDSITITKVNFRIARFANAPAVKINFYYSPLDDTATIADNKISIPPVLIGSVDLPANGANKVSAAISLGDSVNSLFKIKTDTGNIFPGYQGLFVGLSFSGDPNRLNNWALTDPGAPESNNTNTLWIYDVDDPAPRHATTLGEMNSASATFYLEVFGHGFNPLPVTLAEFNARRSGKVNLLNWKTQQEFNAGYFVVERSNDDRNYNGIGQVAAAGNSNTIRNYAFTDNNPVNGVNYYRLRIVDKDNSVKFSAIRSIRNAGIADINIYPNPVTDKLNVAINADEATVGQLTITDIIGKAIYSGSVKLPQGNTILPVPVNNISAGSYVIKIQLNDDVIVKKFSKQ